MPRSIRSLILFLLALTSMLVVGCSDTTLRLLPEGLEEAIDEADINTETPDVGDLIRLTGVLTAFPDDKPEEDEPETPTEPEDEPIGSGELCDNTFLVTDFSHPGDVWEVSAFPLIAHASNPSYEIAQGEPATFNVSWTAICGDIQLEYAFLIVDQDLGAGWNVAPYEAGIEVEARDPITDITLGSGASTTLSYVPEGDELHYLAYSQNADIIGGTVAIDPIVIPEGETFILQYRLPGEFSELVPVGERFGMSLDLIGWTDLATGTYIRMGTIYPWGFPMGGLVAQGEELPYMGPGVVYNVVE